ncbi:hypothetical protein RHSIM_Rhsim09G0118900 [Rhododendron simsii]|uniref:Peptidase A1 domain-containing protein n=1 Tax=Rhododendron simsii TaxID=118357 RepID=A0A834GGI8_RHOSS|nr:hypothetical protein RHSIM_Rhsim09G0118900 [Rhododendron simsii]
MEKVSSKMVLLAILLLTVSGWDTSKGQITEAQVPESCSSAVDCESLCGVRGNCGNGVYTCEVGGQSLSISESVFKTPGTIIDSGTVITRLAPVAYAALRTAFQQALKNYTLIEGISIFDTCYDFTGYDTVTIPRINFLFAGNIEVPIDISGILYDVGLSRFCLAFAGNSDASDVGIFGNVQQQTLDVVYDVAGGVPGAFGARSLEQEPPQYCTTDAECQTELHPSYKCVEGKCICPKGRICLDQL